MRAICIALLMASVASAADAWLESVKPIIQSDEESAYLAFSDEASREHFREIFWLLRNVSADEYFERLALADAQFGSVKLASGARTDQGRVLLSLGRPSRVQRFPSSKMFVQSELWDYDAAPEAGTKSAIRLIFFRPNNAGLYKLYSPSVDTIRALLNPQSNNKGLFPINDVITENDIAERIQASPAEMEILQAAVSIARGITGIGNDEILSRARSPRYALLKTDLQEQVQSRLLRAAAEPEVDVYWGVTGDDGAAAARLAIRLAAADKVRLKLQTDGALVDDLTLNLGFAESRDVQILRRYSLLADLTFNLIIEVDGRTYRHILSGSDAGAALGSILVGEMRPVGADSDRPFRFGDLEFQPGDAPRQAALVVSGPMPVRWKLVKNGRAISSWTTSAEDVHGGALAVTALPDAAGADDGLSIEAEAAGEYRSAAWDRGSSSQPTTISYNADLTQQYQQNLIGLQHLAAGRLEEGKAAFHRAMGVPSYAATRAKVNLSRVLMEEGEMDDARKLLIEALQQAPEDVTTLTLLGLLEERAGNRTLSAQYYRRALAILPSPSLRAALQQAETPQ